MKRSVFVIESSHDVRVFLRTELEARNYLVLSAADGKSALEALKSLPPPIAILLDFDLPMMAGEDLVAELARSERTRYIPVVQISSPGRPRHPLARHVIAKPIGAEQLLALLETL